MRALIARGPLNILPCCPTYPHPHRLQVWLGSSAKTNVVPVPTFRVLSAAGMSFVFAISAGIAFRATSAAVLWVTASKRAAVAVSVASLALLIMAPQLGAAK